MRVWVNNGWEGYRERERVWIRGIDRCKREGWFSILSDKVCDVSSMCEFFDHCHKERNRWGDAVYGAVMIYMHFGSHN